MNKYIPFNQPYFSGNETKYIRDAVFRRKISGNGHYTNLCHNYFENELGFNKVLLTSSCTDALEMAAILLDIGPDDEVLVPSYTFVSTANAFALRGAKIIFVDSRSDHPGMDEIQIEERITNKTKAIVVVHYAGVACDMDKIMDLAKQYNLFVVEDAAQAIDSYYFCANGSKKTLGTIGHLAAFSFHETKNIISGEGGLLVINDEKFVKRAEIIWEKGTNRTAFFRGEINKYSWVDLGSSFLPSDMIAAFLWAQLENIDEIQNKRKHIWNTYYQNLCELENNNLVKLPKIPEFAFQNAHMFYIVLSSLEKRSELINYLNEHGINTVFHYLPLHKSSFYLSNNQDESLLNSEMYSDCLLRLPFFFDLKDSQISYISKKIYNFFNRIE